MQNKQRKKTFDKTRPIPTKNKNTKFSLKDKTLRQFQQKPIRISSLSSSKKFQHIVTANKKTFFIVLRNCQNLHLKRQKNVRQTLHRNTFYKRQHPR